MFRQEYILKLLIFTYSLHIDNSEGLIPIYFKIMFNQRMTVNYRVALIGEIIKARQEIGISQKKLEELSGVKQPIIARMEKGSTSPQIDTVLKVLAALGKTLAVVPLNTK